MVLHLLLHGAPEKTLRPFFDDHAYGVGDDMDVELPTVFGQGRYELDLEVAVDCQCLSVGQLALITRVIEVVGEERMARASCVGPEPA